MALAKKDKGATKELYVAGDDMDAADLHTALEEAGIPIVGVSVGDYLDRRAWRIDFAPNATPSDRANADIIKATFVFRDRRLLKKSVIVSRLTDEQVVAVLGVLTPKQMERWRSPDKPMVYVDDPEMIAALVAAGVNPSVILA